MEEINKQIMWISGRCGCGKTKLADSIIQDFEKENKKTLRLYGQDFTHFLVDNIKAHTIEKVVPYFQNYDLLVIDDLDLTVKYKRATQKEIKWIIQKICTNNRTKVILITQKRARKLKNLKFNSKDCFYLRLKTPSNDLKRNLFREWLEKENFIVSPEKIEETIRKTDNLFQLKGVFSRIRFFNEKSVNS